MGNVRKDWGQIITGKLMHRFAKRIALMTNHGCYGARAVQGFSIRPKGTNLDAWKWAVTAAFD